jgi:hypothetical protein
VVKGRDRKFEGEFTVFILNVEEYLDVKQLVDGITEKFSSGVSSITLVKGYEMIGILLSRQASEKVLVRETAELWLAHPEMLEGLESSLIEESESWGEDCGE